MIAFITILQCLALNLSPQNYGWKQPCLSLSRGGLGLRSVAVHSTAAYLGSITSSSPDLVSSHYAIDAINLFNLQVSAEDITMNLELPNQCTVRLWQPGRLCSYMYTLHFVCACLLIVHSTRWGFNMAPNAVEYQMVAWSSSNTKSRGMCLLS